MKINCQLYLTLAREEGGLSTSGCASVTHPCDVREREAVKVDQVFL